MIIPKTMRQHVDKGVFYVQIKAKKIVENGNIKVDHLAKDRYTFKVESTSKDDVEYITSIDLQTREGLCSCQYMQHNQGRCSHLLAAQYWVKQHIINEVQAND